MNYTGNKFPADRPVVLSIAGFDPCGGAGVLADIKTFEQLKTMGMAVLTANTLQTEESFYELEWQAANDICRQLEILMRRYRMATVKIGIVRDSEMLAKIVATIHRHSPGTYIIWDPVLKSSTGFSCFSEKDRTSLKDILKQVNLITPNLPEFEQLKQFIGPEQTVLLKGGHNADEPGVDVLYEQGQEIKLFPEIQTAYAKHGSGCVLAAAIAAYIAKGHNLSAACMQAKRYIERFLNSHPALLGYHHAP